MNIQTLITNYADYSLWANQQYVNWLSAQPLEQLNQEVPSSFSSILKTLNHIWAIEEYWYSVIAQKPGFENRYGIEDLNADEVFKGLINRSTALANKIKSFTEAQLTENLKVVSPWLDTNQPRFEYILQLVNHGTYHRGQLATISHHTGLTGIPNTDYVFFKAAQQQ